MTIIPAHAPFPPGQFGLIYTDFPWLYKMRSDKGHKKSPHAHYPGMTFEEMAAMRDAIMFASAPDCVLFMWTTWAAHPDDDIDFLQDALTLMKLFGFRRKTGGHWAKTTRHGKQNMGTGYVMRGASEPFLIGTRGTPKIKHKGQRNAIFTGAVPENFNDLGIHIASPAREHSRKPDEMPVLLENLFHGPYLELFGRTQREGWTVWGNDTEKF